MIRDFWMDKPRSKMIATALLHNKGRTADVFGSNTTPPASPLYAARLAVTVMVLKDPSASEHTIAFDFSSPECIVMVPSSLLVV